MRKWKFTSYKLTYYTLYQNKWPFKEAKTEKWSQPIKHRKAWNDLVQQNVGL